MTVDYLIKELRAAGVQPGGDLVNGKRRWTQAVPLLKSDIMRRADAGAERRRRHAPADPGQ